MIDRPTVPGPSYQRHSQTCRDAFDDVVRRALKTKTVELVRVILGCEVRRADELVAVALAFGGREYAVLTAAE